MKKHYWRLPEKIDEVLPPAARQLEILRRQVLDIFHSWGYDYILPPLIEYLDSLLAGSSRDLELQTFKSVDLLSGRMLGVRPDITCQAARIDANSIPTQGTQRLCYAGSVMHANPTGVGRTRNPLLAGAELFGSGVIDADAEILNLMVEVLHAAKVAAPIVELGHVGIYRALIADLSLNAIDERELFDAVQMKSPGDIEQSLARIRGDRGRAELLMRLTQQIGDPSVLAGARRDLAGAPAGVAAALDDLEVLLDLIHQNPRGVDIRMDLSELAGYGYHTGIVFAAYSEQFGRSVARGGRYDAIGEVYGRARPATGFDINLKSLAATGLSREPRTRVPTLAGLSQRQRESLNEMVNQLRKQGKRVVTQLGDDAFPLEPGDQTVKWLDGEWHIHEIRHESESDHG